MPKIQGENTDNEALNIFKNKLHVNIKSEDLDRSHRLGKYRLAGQANSRPRPIIVKFTRYNKRADIYSAKKKLKSTGISISESLTTKRYDLYKATQRNTAIKSTWTLDGRIICLLNNNKRIVVQTIKDLNNISP